MTRPLQFIPFKSRSDKGWAEAWELYEKSFPYNERWNAEGYDRAFGDPNFEADGIWRGDEFIGILFHWGADGYRYVEHLAVSPALRGQNMGSAALSAFCRKVVTALLYKLAQQRLAIYLYHNITRSADTERGVIFHRFIFKHDCAVFPGGLLQYAVIVQSILLVNLFFCVLRQINFPL